MDDAPIYWDSVCGSAPEWAFWSNNLTVYTDNPRFTLCFQNTVLPWTAELFFFATIPLHLLFLIKRPTRERACIGYLTLLKLVLCLGIACLAITKLVHLIVESNSTFKPKIMFAAPIIDILVMLILMVVLVIERRKGEHSSAIVFIFWLLWTIVEALILISKVEEQRVKIPDAQFYYDISLIALCISGLQLFLHCFADPGGKRRRSEEREPLLGWIEPDPESRICPEKKSSWLNRFTFMWITELVIRGYRKPIEFEDVWKLSKENQSEVIADSLQDAWQKREAKLPPRSEEEEEDEEEEVRVQQPKKRRTRVSLFAVLATSFGPSFSVAGLFKIVSDMLSFVQPQILSLIIAFIKDSHTAFVWHGYVLAVSLFVVAQLKTFLLQQYFHNCYSTGMRLRTAIIGLVYRKALRLTGSSRGETTVGEIVNLMSVDAQKLQDTPIFLHNIWSAPLQMILAIVFLWLELGPSVLAGVGVMVLLVPLNAVLTAKMRTFQIRQMKMKDERIKVTNEVLNGIKVLKLYSWEHAFRSKIENIRAKETQLLRNSAYLGAMGSISWFCAPYLVALTTFAVYVLSSPYHILDAQKAFVSLSLFNILQFPMSMLPGVISMIVQTSVSVKRINNYLEGDELDPNATEKEPVAGGKSEAAITVENGDFAWSRRGAACLSDINLQVPKGQLFAVVGEVGSGKSSLINAILGEMYKRSGRVCVKGSVAYVAQQAWCQNASLRDNILFGQRMSTCKYEEILDACSLKPDLQVLAAGDQTEIGEKGINLSGGQKQRVSMARALYSNADVYLLDDPLSAVDAHVGRHIFDEVISREHGFLRNKTCLLVTHAVSFLPRCDKIVVMNDGKIDAFGSCNELLAEDGPFAAFLREHLAEEEEEEEEDEEEMKEEDEDSEVTEEEKGVKDDERTFKRQLRRTVSRLGRCEESAPRLRRQSSTAQSDDVDATAKAPGSQLIEAEGLNVGTVKWNVFKSYIGAAGSSIILCLLFAYLSYIGLRVYNNIWLSVWSSINTTKPDGTQDEGKSGFYLEIYGLLTVGLAVAVGVQSVLITMGSYRASIQLHSTLLGNVLRAPMLFFDTTPIGRIINRFSKDMDTVDMNIPMTIRIWTNTFSSVITTIIIVSYASPLFLIALIPLAILYHLIQRFYVNTSRQLKRIDAVKRSPIYSHFQETIVGAATIRSFEKGPSFIEKSDNLVDANQSVYYPNIVSYRWLGVFLESLGNLIILLAGLLAVINHETMKAGLAGLSITYALQITSSLNFMVRMSTDMETYIVAVERIKEYSEIDTEAALVTDLRPPTDWPEQGEVVFRDYAVRYRNDLDLVLRGINVKVLPRQRVGLVGRTGAGKSSLTLALFRILEPASGCILIDGINIAELGLSDLRSRLTIIPQDPVLFSGPLRYNLDPQALISDEELWQSLERAGLRRFVAAQPSGLDMICTEGGENLSVGQRQLVCLARALLRRTRVLILDEATAAVDLATDDQIQATIREHFQHCTIITIAHRLNTVLDYDRIVVLDQGRVKEMDSPDNLLADQNSTFYSMARDAKLV